ncbi:MAG: hypothetical protein HUJ31_14575 [Pseudomonadales bacterium]|nr:hypothetical protein [Pseudomonadales bacterium]
MKAMFWRKRKKEIDASVKLLDLYLAGSTVFFPGRERTPSESAAVQVFMLGMADMQRQVKDTSWDNFLEIYKSILAKYGLAPRIATGRFVDVIGNVASKDEIVERVMILGAQSIARWVGERDANAPIDLIGATKFAQDHPDSFIEVVRVGGT